MMMLTAAGLFIFLSATKAIPENQPCKTVVRCICGSSDIVKFCSSELSDSEEVCERLSQCTSIPKIENSTSKCREGIADGTCKNGITRKKRQSAYSYRSANLDSRNSSYQRNTDCPDPGFISNAVRQTADGSTSSTPRTFKEGEFVIFTCESAEFALQGKSFLQCTSEGTWSSSLPRCISSSPLSEVSCEDPGFVTNGERLNSDGSVSNAVQRYSVGQFVVYTCNEGFALKPHSLITCAAGGKWSKRRPQCISLSASLNTEAPFEEASEALIFCRDPGVNSNSERTPRKPLMSRGFLQGSRLEYSCQKGFYLKGEEELFCLSTGKWSSEIPTCEDVGDQPDFDDSSSCNNPGPVLNGKVTPWKIEDGKLEEVESASQYPTGTRLEYSCEDNTTMEGNPLLVCQEFGLWSADPPHCFAKCGVSYADAILEDPTSVVKLNSSSEWPWAVTLTGDGNRILCSAILLTSDTVITAQHCVLNLKTVYLYFGRVQTNVSNENPDVMIRASTEIILHPGMNETTFENDIALIKFAPRVRYTEKVLPICLPTKESTKMHLRSGSMGYVAGFSISDYRTEQLLLGQLPFLASEDCSVLTRRLRFTLSSTQFCGGSVTEGYRSICSSDSGSAFAFYDSNTDTYSLEGIVSAGMTRPCGTPGTFLIMSKMQSFLPWIHEKLSI